MERFDKESRLRWFGNVQRRECGYIGQKMMNMELSGRRRKGRMFMVVVKDNMQRVGVMEADVEKGQSNVVNTKNTLFEDSHTGLQILMHTRKFINNLHRV